ncbi:MAG: formylglycine-generating enzyme family protein [Verrucomicrobia bacterium]|nr:formylglycine-generating enzyme family protein [Verrucomicrobiota bacterium]
MKHTALLAALAAFLIANQSANAQGALNPPSAPAESQKSLQEIYDAIQSARADFETAKAEFATLVQQAVPSVPGMVAVLGGTLPSGAELVGQKVGTFYIGTHEVTLGLWRDTAAWATSSDRGNPYSGINAGYAASDNHPIAQISWLDALKWCNALSERHGLTPVYYDVNGVVFRSGQELPSENSYANGYRLPKEAEWEWAARGGVLSKGYNFSGSNNLDEVGWYWQNSSGAEHNVNSGRGTWQVGQKQPNELGIFDMSGNVVEWCWDVYSGDGVSRILRGGSALHFIEQATVIYRNHWAATTQLEDHVGFRLARSY